MVAHDGHSPNRDHAIPSGATRPQGDALPGAEPQKWMQRQSRAGTSLPRMARHCYVYILANWQRTLYIGVTNNPPRRMAEHWGDGERGSKFARRNRLRRLVYVEEHLSPMDAIRREKQLKGWVRRRKVALISSANPGWRDLAGEWGWRPPLDSAGPRMIK